MSLQFLMGLNKLSFMKLLEICKEILLRIWEVLTSARVFSNTLSLRSSLNVRD
jgi:hypothetical protein